MLNQSKLLTLTVGLALTASAQAVLYIDFTEVPITGTRTDVVVKIAGSINTAAFEGTVTTLPLIGLGAEGNIFISGSVFSQGQVGLDNAPQRLISQSTSPNWYPGLLSNNQTVMDFGNGAFVLERGGFTPSSLASLVVNNGVRGVLPYVGPSGYIISGGGFSSIGITPAEQAAGPYITTATSNGVSDSIIFSFNGVGVPEPSTTLLGGLASLMLLRRRHRS